MTSLLALGAWVLFCSSVAGLMWTGTLLCSAGKPFIVNHFKRHHVSEKSAIKSIPLLKFICPIHIKPPISRPYLKAIATMRLIIALVPFFNVPVEICVSLFEVPYKGTTVLSFHNQSIRPATV